jgi:flagellar assembly protein FliH
MKRVQEEPPEDVEEGFSEGLDPLTVEELITDESKVSPVVKAPTISREELDRMTTEAQAQADQIIAEAEEAAEQIRAEASAEGEKKGYEAGMAKAEQDCRAKYEQLERELKASVEAQKDQQNRDYEARVAELEPMLVDKLADIFAAVTGARLENEKETVMFLLNRALTQAESGRNYIVHVSPQDYEEVRAHKEDVAKGTGLMAENFEIVEDVTLSAGACMIESEGGIWDCSLGTQLKLLAAQLKILSYEP